MSQPHRRRRRRGDPPKASAGTPSVSKAGDKGEKQPRSTSTAPLTGTSYAEAAKRVRVAVLPEDYPQVYLSNEELAELEEAIMDDVVTSEWDSAVAFRGIHFRVGYLLIDCLDQDSADWLRTVTPQLRTWKGVPLDTRVGEDIPAAYNVTVFCPRSAERSDEELLMMLGRQNRMEVDSWKVISRRNDGGGALLVIGIDQLTRDEIVSKGHQLNLRFGTVSPQEPLGAKEEAIADMDVESEDERLSHSQEVAQEPLREDIDEKEADVTLTEGTCPGCQSMLPLHAPGAILGPSRPADGPRAAVHGVVGSVADPFSPRSLPARAPGSRPSRGH
ncbi:uncharacterized protein LOC122319873 [Drosophila ficusphila]|uniref:uncharacterized protein LOC122319873 n=1 Tax=Drosophila ficusphila TaxID=30025 RepID=UPI001C89D5A3|nr:uncharacterized protein LOC122319873 [Drosophila ficusphila]